ncbi:hypothetical protein [Nocardia rhamnosiphila]
MAADADSRQPEQLEIGRVLDAEGDPEFAAEIATTAVTATLHRLLDDR